MVRLPDSQASDSILGEIWIFFINYILLNSSNQTRIIGKKSNERSENYIMIKISPKFVRIVKMISSWCATSGVKTWLVSLWLRLLRKLWNKVIHHKKEINLNELKKAFLCKTHVNKLITVREQARKRTNQRSEQKQKVPSCVECIIIIIIIVTVVIITSHWEAPDQCARMCNGSFTLR